MSGIDYESLMALRETGKNFSWDARDTLLFALAIGMGRDPLDPHELKFVYEGEGFVAMPTLAVVVARSMLARSLPINMAKLLHAEQSLTLYRPMSVSGSVLADTRITQIIDKGADKGALIYSETVARDSADGEPLFTIGMMTIARGDGGFGGPTGPIRPRRVMPQRDPDHIHTTETRVDQALLYRLTGDRNPLHADPLFAKRAGFEKPILHGLCSYAIACRAILVAVCDYDPARIAGCDVRFTSPVYPGDSIETDIWVVEGGAEFRCRVPERGTIVLDGGWCPLR